MEVNKTKMCNNDDDNNVEDDDDNNEMTMRRTNTKCHAHAWQTLEPVNYGRACAPKLERIVVVVVHHMKVHFHIIKDNK